MSQWVSNLTIHYRTIVTGMMMYRLYEFVTSSKFKQTSFNGRDVSFCVWLNFVIYTDKHTHCARCNNFSRTSLSKGNKCNKVNPMWSTNLWDKARLQHQEHCTYSLCVGSLTSPANHVTGTLKIEWTSAYGYSSYLRRLVMLVSSLIAPARYGKIKLW